MKGFAIIMVMMVSLLSSEAMAKSTHKWGDMTEKQALTTWSKMTLSERQKAIQNMRLEDIDPFESLVERKLTDHEYGLLRSREEKLCKSEIIYELKLASAANEALAERLAKGEDLDVLDHYELPDVDAAVERCKKAHAEKLKK